MSDYKQKVNEKLEGPSELIHNTAHIWKVVESLNLARSRMNYLIKKKTDVLFTGNYLKKIEMVQ